MIAAPDDDGLERLSGQLVHSSDGVTSYLVGTPLGRGGTAIAFLAEARRSGATRRVVLKVTRPWFVQRSGEAAMLTARKETAALGRVSRERPTPFVVELLDSGLIDWRSSSPPLGLPWLALELVEGGALGTSLGDRVAQCIRSTGAAFHPMRAARAVDCIARGLDAVHALGIVHRDLTPGNLLATGEVPDEIVKITDFGVARPQGMETTFGGLLVGTPGYAAPELASFDDSMTGAWTDVFSLAAITFFLLTGEHYFDVARDPLAAIRQKTRRRLLDAERIHGALRTAEQSCAALDELLAAATSPKRAARPQEARDFAAPVCRMLESLRAESEPLATGSRSLPAPGPRPAPIAPGWTFTHHQGPTGLAPVRSAAWSDEACMALGAAGALQWKPQGWQRVSLADDDMRDLCFVHAMRDGGWLLGGARAMLVILRAEQPPSVVRGPDPGITFDHASGDLETVVVFAGSHGHGPPFLQALTPAGWGSAVPIANTGRVTAIERVAPDEWLVAGSDARGRAALHRFAPLRGSLEPVLTGQALGQPIDIATSALGLLILAEDGALLHQHSLEPAIDDSLAAEGPTACALDANGDPWVACREALFTRRRGVTRGGWQRVHSFSAGHDAVVSLRVGSRRADAVTRNGSVLSGHRDSRHSDVSRS